MISNTNNSKQLNKKSVNGGNLIFDFIDRQIIIDFYKNYPNGSYWKKHLIVERFERLKAIKEFKKEVKKELGKFINLVLGFIKGKII